MSLIGIMFGTHIVGQRACSFKELPSKNVKIRLGCGFDHLTSSVLVQNLICDSLVHWTTSDLLRDKVFACVVNANSTMNDVKILMLLLWNNFY